MGLWDSLFCFYGNLRKGCIILGLLSFMLRIIFFTFVQPQLIGNAFGNDPTSFETIVSLLIVIISGMLGLVGDILLLLGASLKKEKWLKVYLPLMFIVLVFELLCFVVLFVMGVHWNKARDILLLGVWHAWCWIITRHWFNQEWNTSVPTTVVTSDDF